MYTRHNILHLHDETLIHPIHEHIQLHASQYKHNIHHTPYTNTVTTTDIKTNMCHIYMYISIVSRHLVKRGNSKILRTPPPNISSSEEILPRLTRHTLAQLRTNKSPFLISYCIALDLWTDPAGVSSLLARWTETLDGGPQAVRSDPPPPASKGHMSWLRLS